MRIQTNWLDLDVCFRKIEQKTIQAAAHLAKIKPVDLIVHVRKAIMRSDHPSGLCYMRSTEALRQEYMR
jgi:hypothetical protein